MMDDFEKLTRMIIQTKLVEVLKGNEEYVEALVQAVFTREVNEHGGKPDYHSKNKMPWLEYCARDAIENAARTAVLEVVKELQPQIHAGVKKSLGNDAIVSAFTKAVMDSMDHDYNISVTVGREPPE